MTAPTPESAETPDAVLARIDDEWLILQRAAGRLSAGDFEIGHDLGRALGRLMSAIAERRSTPVSVRVAALRVAETVTAREPLR